LLIDVLWCFILKLPNKTLFWSLEIVCATCKCRITMIYIYIYMHIYIYNLLRWIRMNKVIPAVQPCCTAGITMLHCWKWRPLSPFPRLCRYILSEKIEVSFLPYTEYCWIIIMFKPILWIKWYYILFTSLYSLITVSGNCKVYYVKFNECLTILNP